MSEAPIDGWKRPVYSPGGGDADLYFVVYGNVPDALQPSRSRHRITSLPETLTATIVDAREQPDVHGKLLSGDLGKVLATDFPMLYDLARDSQRALFVRARVIDPPDLLYLRSLVGFVQAALDAGGLVVLDLFALRIWGRQAWADQLFGPERCDILSHFTTLVSDRDGWKWVHTRGLGKFGRPDVGIYGVPAHELEMAVALTNRLASYQALGARVADGQPIRMEGVPGSLVARCSGHLDDPEYNNVHLRLDWAGITGRSEVGPM